MNEDEKDTEGAESGSKKSGSKLRLNEKELIGNQISADGKRTIQMFDIMLPKGASLKAYSR